MKGWVPLLAASLLFSANAARAQVEVQVSISAQTVEVGQELQIQISAQGGSESPDNPRLAAPATFTVRGPSVGTQWSMGIRNGRMTRSVGLSATWLLIPQSPGRFVLGPATVTLGGTQYQSKTFSVEVVPQGSLPGRPPRARRSPFGGGPFDPFGTDPNFPSIEDLLEQQAPTLPEYPRDLEIPAALDDVAFLRATVEPERVYIGQQVTLRIYAYGGRGPYNQASAREPAHPDFLARPILDGGVEVELARVPIGERIWFAAKLREIALFPLRTGQLQIGSMEFGFGGGRYPARTPSNALLRKSPALSVEVVEPPLADRPAGYQLGDVGSFELSAEVAPRQVDVGGAVSVIVTLRGTGKLPHALKTPTRTGVDFLTPATTEKLDIRDGKLGGAKTFTYVVRVTSPGTIELGDISLPYFDPDEHRYHVATASLGSLTVSPSPTPVVDTPGTDPKGLEQLTQTIKPRSELGGSLEQREYVADKNIFWGALLLGPISVLSLTGLIGLGRRARARILERRHSNTALLAADLKAADEAAVSKRMADTAAAVERALYRAVEAATEVKARGLLRRDLAATLSGQGLTPSLSQEVVDCLEQCDSMRFGAPDPGEAMKLAARVRVLCKKLGASKPRREARELKTPSEEARG